MKKIRFACLTLLAPLALLSACTSTPELSLESNWYQQTGERHVVSPTNERLAYEISFRKSEQAEKSQYYLSYENGTYATTLTGENITLADGTVTTGYHFATYTEIDVTFTLNGATTEPLHDKMETHAFFLDTDSGLKPVRSWQTVHSTTPKGSPTAKYTTLKDAYATYEYTLTTEYNAELTEAKIKLDYLDKTDDDDGEPMTVSIKGGGSYFDNEQILFALRGLDFPNVGSFRSINPSERKKVTVNFTDTPVASRESCKFTMDGTPVEATLDAFEFSLRYSQEYPGESKTFVYAKKTSSTNNVYRNIPLRMETPVLNSHGTLTYKLISANFS